MRCGPEFESGRIYSSLDIAIATQVASPSHLHDARIYFECIIHITPNVGLVEQWVSELPVTGNTLLKDR